MPDRLQGQVDVLEQRPEIDLGSVGMQLFGAKKEVWVRERDLEKVKINALFYSPVLHASSIWRKDSFERNGLRFRQEMVRAEEYVLWTRALVSGLKLVNLPEVLYKYRIHDAQSTLQTEKSAEKCRMVQQNYLRMALPSLSPKNVEAFPKRIWPVFFANLKDGFFDKKQLAKRLFKMSTR
jgi:hypothetical protein